MKSEHILYALSQVDDELIAESAPDHFSRHHGFPWRKFAATAAIFVLVAGAGIGLWNYFSFEDHSPAQTSDTRWPQKEVSRSSTDTSEISLVPKWEEQTISQQYDQLVLDQNTYSSRDTSISSDHIGEKLARTTASGVDEYTDELHTTGVTTYSITDISMECAVAAQFDGQNDFYVFTNSNYIPKTLGDFIEDLNLRQTVFFGSVYYQQKPETDSVSTVEFVDLQDSKIWDMLLSDETLTPVADSDSLTLENEMSVSVNLPLLGYENISLGLTKDGYLVTNILDTAKVFKLGEEKVEEFVDYVVENCTGYEILYLDFEEEESTAE